MAEDSSKSLTILLVDDDALVRRVFARILTAAGHLVVEAAHVNEAMGKLGASRFDLVFTDVYMPDADGFDVLRQIRAARPSLPVVVMSGRFGIDPFSKAMMAMLIKLGAACTLVKPARCADILSALRCAISLRPEDQT